MLQRLLSTLLKFVAHNNVALVETKALKTVCMGRWIYSSEYSFYLEFLA
jgi:hypothetical protein